MPCKILYREKRIYSGIMQEVEIYPVYENGRRVRGKKEKASTTKQKNLNAKNAKKKAIRLVNTNFTQDDLMLTLSYKETELPKTEDEAIKDIEKYIKNLRKYRQKKGLSDLKYIAVIEYKEAEEGKKIRIHHHLIINKLDRDDAEKIWTKGRANTMRLQLDESGLEGVTRYILKDPKGRKRWKQSRNLKKPEVKISDTKITKRMLEKMSKNPDDKVYFEKKYMNAKGNKYIFNKCKVEVNDITGISLYIKLRQLN